MNINPVAGNAVSQARENMFFSDAKCVGIQRIIGYALGVNVNQTNTDVTIPLIMLPGSNFVVTKVQLNNASVSLTTATASVYPAVAAGGNNIVADAALSALTSATKNLAMTLAAGASANVLNQTTQANSLYFRVGTAQGAAATVDVYIWGECLP